MTVSATDQLPLVDALPVDHLFDMHVDLQPAQIISTPIGTKLVFITSGGTIDGPATGYCSAPTASGASTSAPWFGPTTAR